MPEDWWTMLRCPPRRPACTPMSPTPIHTACAAGWRGLIWSVADGKRAPTVSFAAAPGTTTPTTAVRRTATGTTHRTATTTSVSAFRVQFTRPMGAVQGLRPCAPGLSNPALPAPAVAGQKALMPRRPVAKSEVRRGSIFHERSYSVTLGLHLTRNKHRKRFILAKAIFWFPKPN